MSWVTVIWSMIASGCLTLGAIHWLVWYRNRTALAHLLFAATAASTAVYTCCELRLMRVETPAELLVALRWSHLAFFCWIVSSIWFVRIYLGAGRRWLAWTLCALRALYLLPSFLFGASVNYREITSLRQVPFLGDSVTIFKGIPNPWMLLGYATMLLIFIFVVDASITAWRLGDRRKALMVGGSVVFFLLLGNVETSLIYWRNLAMPIVLSPLYLGVVAVMGYEVSRDVLRASQLVHELQASEAELRESEARMSLAIDAASIGIWIRDLVRHEIWASQKWRALFGFAPSEPLEFSTVLNRLHPDDREGFEHALARAVDGTDGGHYETEYRLLLPDGSTRWIASQGRVEYDASGRPLLTRGAVRDVSERKRAEVVVRSLSGRLLSAQEEERRRIARELHDNLSQRVALFAIEIDQLAMMSEHRPAVAESLEQLGGRTAELAKEIHNLAHRLHSTKLLTLGLQTAVEGHCREMRAEGLQVKFEAENVPGGLTDDVALCLFRVVQEGLNNVVKHSGVREAHVRLTGTGSGLRLTIADSGRGFDGAAAAVKGGLGLVSMRERVSLVGGAFTLESHPDRGATIIAHVPLAAVDGTAAADPSRVA